MSGSQLKYKHFNIPGHVHELTFSCYKRQPLLNLDRAYQYLVPAINIARAKHRFALMAYVFMPEHIHLLLFPKGETYSISSILKSIKQSSSRRIINHIREKNPSAMKMMQTGLKQPKFRFWQDGGGYDRNYWSTDEIWNQVNYIHNNPVRRELVDCVTDWKWSSAKDWILDVDGPLKIDKNMVG